jgi:hypothetical protein
LFIQKEWQLFSHFPFTPSTPRTPYRLSQTMCLP